MFDLALRHVKEQTFQSVCRSMPAFIQPTHLTLLAFLSGLMSCRAAASASTGAPNILSLAAWLLNRLLDSLDGSLARARKKPTELGGFLDLLGDFIIYSLVPIAVGYGEDTRRGGFAEVDWRAVAFLEASFHINNFVLCYVAAIEGKVKGRSAVVHSELTSIVMRPALVEGLESGLLFTLMLAFPGWLETLAWGMGMTVSLGVLQRVWYVVPVLARLDGRMGIDGDGENENISS